MTDLVCVPSDASAAVGMHQMAQPILDLEGTPMSGAGRLSRFWLFCPGVRLSSHSARRCLGGSGRKTIASRSNSFDFVAEDEEPGFREPLNSP